MHSFTSPRFRGAGLAAALAFAALSDSAAQSRVVLPAGSVIMVRTTTPLQSATAKAGDTFETTVEAGVGVDEYTVIPAGSRIRGRITAAQPATRDQSGVIDVTFDQLTLPDGSSYGISGKLTSTDSAERRQIAMNANPRVVLVGGRGGIGAAIAGASRSNTLLSALGGLLSEGLDVNVAPGSPLAVELERALTLRGRGRARSVDASTIFTAPERIRAAQTQLARLNYYRGPVTGKLDDATRKALFAFQIDRQLTGTGNLDGRTATALGLNLSTGITGPMLSAEEASTLRRDAQTMVSGFRNELGINGNGRLNPNRAYAQADLDLWFALSAFADNASIYEQVIRSRSNDDAIVLAGRSLLAAARRVDTAMQAGTTSDRARSSWAIVRRQVVPLE